MSESVDCRCESILSPQMEWVPGPHHDVDCPMRRAPATTLADTGNFIVRVPKEES